jgi:D-alanine-D-alanine ligase
MSRIAILYNEPALPADHPDYASEAGVLESVDAFAKALEQPSYQVTRLGLGSSLTETINRLSVERPDIVVNLCEGFAGHASGEAYLTGLLELLDLRYTGSSPECLSLVRDKVRTKQVLAASGIATAEYWLVRREDNLGLLPQARQMRAQLAEGKLFVKPAAEDASLGIDEHSVVENWAELSAKIPELQCRYGDVLVERYLDGREFNVGIIALPKLHALPLAEIEFQTDSQFPWPIVTYASKWTADSAGFRATPVCCPALVDQSLAARITETALAAFTATGCRDYARVDLRVTPDGGIYVLEVNANPDAGPSAGLARALEVAGIGYDQFVEQLVNTARMRDATTATSNSPGRHGDSPAESRKAGVSAARSSPELRTTDTSGLRLRALDARDKGSLLEILAACQMFRPDEIQVAAEVLDEALRDGASSHYRVLIAEADDQPVGWSCHGRVPLTDATYDLYWIAVHPTCQGRGVGQTLLMEIDRLLLQAGARWLLAETSSSSIYDKTRAFYERAGFTVVGDVPDFYRPQDGRITYGKRLAH